MEKEQNSGRFLNKLTNNYNMFKNQFFLLLCLSLVSCFKNTNSSTETSTNYTSSTTYMDAREQLKNENDKVRFDADIVLSEKEQAVNEQLVELRKQMLKAYDEQNFFPPAAPFHQSKKHIESTPLFKVLKQMPKGGALHLHFDASVDYGWLIDKAIDTPNSYVYLGPSNDKFIYGQIHFYLPGKAPEGFEPMAMVAQTNKNFRAEMKDLLVLDQEVTQDTFAIWDEFENIFSRVRGFYTYEPVVKDFYKNVIDNMLADGVQHIEDRIIISGSLYDLEHTPDYFPIDTRIKYIKEIREEVRKEYPDFSIALIYTHLRFLPKEVIFEELVNAFQLRKQYPDLIKGFDLVANEDDGNRTLFYLDNWLKMDSLEQAYGVQLPFYFHDGESDWASVDNLYDAVLLNSRRIGHGFNLNHFPALQEKIKGKDICLEICPLSNQILGYLKDLRLHPANYLLKSGVQCVISSDDPAIFDYRGLTYDYWSIFLAWELDLKALKKLSRNSIEYSSLDAKAKAEAMLAWKKRWDSFISEFSM